MVGYDNSQKLRDLLVEGIDQWLKTKSTAGFDRCHEAAEAVSCELMSEMPDRMLLEHVPLHIFSLMAQGLITVPLAPEYEAHRLMCKTCQKNYELALEKLHAIRDVTSYSPELWKEHTMQGGLYRDDLVNALDTSDAICVVSGEVLTAIYDEEMCERIVSFANQGKSFKMIAGPLVECPAGSDKSPFVEMARDSNNPNVEFYVSDRRQDLHFAFSDTNGVIYLEAKHEPADESRRYIGGNDAGAPLEKLIRSRFEDAFYSPDVRPFENDDDVIPVTEDDLRQRSMVVRKTGLSLFGKYGLRAQERLRL